MIVVEPARHDELRPALELLASRSSLSRAEISQQTDLLIRYVQKRGLSLEQCLVARSEGRMLASCLCVDAPGRTSTTFSPTDIESPAVAEAVVELLMEAARRAATRDVRLLQGLVPPQARAEGDLYARAGFVLLAQLIYMESDLTQVVLPTKVARGLTWWTYSADRHELFARVVQGTYEDSLDCAALTGLRCIEDVLASHRAVGEFDPACWQVGVKENEPVGVILLAYVPETTAFEVVYMGVLPQQRRRGHGATLLARGVEIARQHAVTKLTLAVDAANEPARTLYDRFGFRETARRDVWIKLLSGSSDPDAGHLPATK